MCIYVEDVITNIYKYKSIYGIIRRTLGRRTRRETQLRFCKVIAVPKSMHGTETWVLTKKEENMKPTAEMKFSRSLEGYSCVDMMRSGEISEDLDIFAIQDNIAEKVS
jgi:hypothetical protein